MIRMVKTSRLIRVINWFESVFRPPVIAVPMVKIFLGITLLVHLCSCLYWLTKVTSNTEEEVEDFLIINGLSMDHPISEKYLLCFYYVNTVFTTVGFGDITAGNKEERVFAVIIMYLGSLVFGTLLAEVQSAVAMVRRRASEKRNTHQQAKDFLRDEQAPPEMERRLLTWLDFAFDSKSRVEQRQKHVYYFPKILSRELAQHLHKGLLLKIPSLRAIKGPYRQDFLIDLYMAMKEEAFCENTAIALNGNPADRLCYVNEGTIRAVDRDGRTVTTLGEADFFGETALYSEDQTWTTSLGKAADFIAVTNVTCLTLHRRDFSEVLEKYPEELQEEVANIWQDFEEKQARMQKIMHRLPLLRWGQMAIRLQQRSAGSVESRIQRAVLMKTRQSTKQGKHEEEKLKMQQNQRRLTNWRVEGIETELPNAATPDYHSVSWKVRSSASPELLKLNSNPSTPKGGATGSASNSATGLGMASPGSLQRQLPGEKIEEEPSASQQKEAMPPQKRDQPRFLGDLGSPDELTRGSLDLEPKGWQDAQFEELKRMMSQNSHQLSVLSAKLSDFQKHTTTSLEQTHARMDDLSTQMFWVREKVTHRH